MWNIFKRQQQQREAKRSGEQHKNAADATDTVLQRLKEDHARQASEQQQQLQQLNRELEEYNASLSALQEQNREYSNHQQSLESELASVHAEFSKMQEEKDRVERLLSITRQQLAVEVTRRQNLLPHMEDRQQEQEQQQQQQQQQQQDQPEQKQQQQQETGETKDSAAAAQLETVKAQVVALEKLASQLETQVGELKKRKKTLKKKIHKGEGKLKKKDKAAQGSQPDKNGNEHDKTGNGNEQDKKGNEQDKKGSEGDPRGAKVAKEASSATPSPPGLYAQLRISAEADGEHVTPSPQGDAELAQLRREVRSLRDQLAIRSARPDSVRRSAQAGEPRGPYAELNLFQARKGLEDDDEEDKDNASGFFVSHAVNKHTLNEMQDTLGQLLSDQTTTTVQYTQVKKLGREMMKTESGRRTFAFMMEQTMEKVDLEAPSWSYKKAEFIKHGRRGEPHTRLIKVQAEGKGVVDWGSGQLKLKRATDIVK
eukprot:g7795.t1